MSTKFSLVLISSVFSLNVFAGPGQIGSGVLQKGQCRVEERKNGQSRFNTIQMKKSEFGHLYIEQRVKHLKGNLIVQTNPNGELDIMYRLVANKTPYISATQVRGGKASLCGELDEVEEAKDSAICVTCEVL